MDTTAHALPTISEPLTWAEICARYPEQWVSLVEILRANETDLEFTTARVIGHGSTRRETQTQARPFRDLYDEMAHIHTGEIVAPHPAWKWV